MCLDYEEMLDIKPNSERWLNLKDLPDEEWEFVDCTKKCYMVSNYSRLKSMKRNTAHERILKTRVGKDGYYYANLSVCGKRLTKKIHRMVAEAFILDKSNFKYTQNDNLINIDFDKLVINHKDGIKTHNNLENLEWCTMSYNEIHANKLGLVPHWMEGMIGKDCPFSKKIVQKTLDNKIIKVWDSMSDVKRELNIPVPHLVRVCKGIRKSTRGFKWCYFDESEVINNG